MIRRALAAAGVLWAAASPAALRAATSVAVKTVGVGVELATAIDNFEDGDDVNLCGGTNVAFSGGAATLTRLYDGSVFHAPGSRSLRLDYALPQPGDYAGFVLPLAPGGGTVDISGYKSIGFWVRGNGGLEHFKIELANASADPARNRAYVYLGDYLDGALTTEWRRVVIPLAAWGNLDGFSNAKEVVFVMERDYADASGFDAAGRVYIDDLALLATSPPVAPLDRFADNWDRHALGGRVGEFGPAPVGRSFDAAVYHDHGRSLKSTYDVSAVGAESGGHFFALGGGASGHTGLPVDLSAYRTLRFHAKAGPAGNPVRFRVEIKSGGGKVASAPIGGLTAAWEPYTIDLGAFGAAQLDRAAVTEVVIVYEKDVIASQGGSLAGEVFFDEIEFRP